MLQSIDTVLVSMSTGWIQIKLRTTMPIESHGKQDKIMKMDTDLDKRDEPNVL